VVSVCPPGVDQIDGPAAVVGSSLTDRAVLDRLAGQAQARRLRDEGLCVLNGLWSEGLDQALAHEAEAAVATATRNAREGYSLRPDGDLLGPFAFATGSGPVLRALHRSPRIVSAVRGLSGRLLVPTSSAYLFYSGADFAGLHADLTKCELVMLATVAGSLRPLVLHPALAGTSPEQLMTLGLESGGAPSGGVPLPPAERGVTVLRGKRIPHHRPACRADEVGVVMTLCYRAAF
jgi:hypothetical protein